MTLREHSRSWRFTRVRLYGQIFAVTVVTAFLLTGFNNCTSYAASAALDDEFAAPSGTN